MHFESPYPGLLFFMENGVGKNQMGIAMLCLIRYFCPPFAKDVLSGKRNMPEWRNW